MPWKTISLVAAVWFIIVGGLLLMPGREPKCLVCGNATLDLVAKVLTLVLAVGALVAALRGRAGNS